MNIGLVSLVANIPALSCVVIAGFLAYSGKEGWGWFLLVAALISNSISRDSKKDDGDGGEEDKPAPSPPKDTASIWRN